MDPRAQRERMVKNISNGIGRFVSVTFCSAHCFHIAFALILQRVALHGVALPSRLHCSAYTSTALNCACWRWRRRSPPENFRFLGGYQLVGENVSGKTDVCALGALRNARESRRKPRKPQETLRKPPETVPETVRCRGSPARELDFLPYPGINLLLN